MKRPRIDWAGVPVTFVPVVQPQCPSCRSERYIHVKGENNGDNSSTEKVICAECSKAYKICRERSLPERGNDESDIG